MKIGMSMNECPICGQTVTTVKAWVACPMMKTNVCMKHCFNKCEYLDEGISLPKCRYREK